MMILAALRYSLPRHSYIVTTCVEWIGAIWKDLSPMLQKLIIHEIEEVVYEEGTDMEWEKILTLLDR